MQATGAKMSLDPETERDIAERAKKWRGGLRQKMSADDQREAIEADRRALVVKVEALSANRYKSRPYRSPDEPQEAWVNTTDVDLDAVLAILRGKP